MILESPILLGIAIALAILTIAVGFARGVRLPRASAVCILLAMGMLALAAGGLSMRWPDPRRAVVMIDMSPSTRTAAYRDDSAREARIRQLLGDVRYTVQSFADGQQIEQILFTQPGERVFRPEFGAGVRGLVFEPNSSPLWELTRKRLQAAVAEALAGEADPKSIEIAVAGEGEQLLITIRYALTRLGVAQTLSVRLGG